jgi:hypothetical protein
MAAMAHGEMLEKDEGVSEKGKGLRVWLEWSHTPVILQVVHDVHFRVLVGAHDGFFRVQAAHQEFFLCVDADAVQSQALLKMERGLGPPTNLEKQDQVACAVHHDVIRHKVYSPVAQRKRVTQALRERTCV